jgi:hypothetical protein
VSRLPLVLFVLLLGLCGVVGWLATQEPAVNQAGVAHPDHPAMALGADGAARHREVLGAGFAFAALTVALFVGLLFFGLRRPGEPVPGKALILTGGTLFLGAFVALFVTYSRYLEDADPEALVLGFPPPTAWMLYGVWGVPLLFIAFYVTRYKEWVFGAGDEVAYQDLLERVRRARTGTTPKSDGR